MKKHLTLLLLTFTVFSLGYSQNSNCEESKKDAEFIKGIWIGEFTQYACGVYETYPMTIEVNEIDGKKFTGFFVWNDLPSTQNGKTTLRGEIKGRSIFLYEDDLITGDYLILNGIYKIEIIDCNTLKGNWKLKKLDDQCDDPQVLKDGGRFLIKKLVPHIVEEEKPDSIKREVVIVETINSTSDYVTLKLWDDGMEDGDIITLKLNGEVALDKFEVTSKPHKIIIPLTEEENILEMFAENVGSIPPNTAAISVLAGGKKIKSLVLKSDLSRSEAIEIIKN